MRRKDEGVHGRARDFGERVSTLYGCVEEGRIIVGDAIVGPLLSYWNLKLQELKYHPEQIDVVRSEFVTDEQILLTNGKALALDELRRQWALVTGEDNRPSPPAAVPAPSRPPSELVLPEIGRPVRGSCEDGHWIRSVSGGGEIAILDDGSVWEVNSSDRMDSALWTSSDEVVVCDGKLINTDQMRPLGSSVRTRGSQVAARSRRSFSVPPLGLGGGGNAGICLSNRLSAGFRVIGPT
jgi:hypothetical protein